VRLVGYLKRKRNYKYTHSSMLLAALLHQQSVSLYLMHWWHTKRNYITVRSEPAGRLLCEVRLYKVHSHFLFT